MAKNTWVYALKKNVKRVLKGRHSKAGKKHIAKVKAKHKSLRGMSRQTHKQLESLSDEDYKAMMKALRGKK